MTSHPQALTVSLWLTDDIYAFIEGCGSSNPHTVLARGRNRPVYARSSGVVLVNEVIYHIS